MLPKLIISDIDGVWTNGSMYYDEKGNEIKKFHTYDSAGVLFCKMLKIPFAIMTGENVKSVKRRAEKLKVKYLYLGVKDKVAVANNLCKELNISFKEVAFIGDDINDYQLLTKVGLSACPLSAPEYIKHIVDWKLSKNGGEGVFREFVEKIMKKNDIDIIELLKNEKFINENNIQ